MSCWGGLLFGPAVHRWYLALGKLFPGPASLKNTVQKIAVDQLFFGPLVNLVLMAYTVTLAGGNQSDSEEVGEGLVYCGAEAVVSLASCQFDHIWGYKTTAT